MRQSAVSSRVQGMSGGISEWVGRAAAWAIVVLMVALVWEVASRYFLNNPTIWAHDLGTILYGIAGVLAGSYTLYHKGHVRIDLLYDRLSERKKIVLDCVSNVLSIAFFFIFLRVSIQGTIRSVAAREFSNMTSWAPPLYPVKIILTLAIFIMLFQMILIATKNFSILLGKKPGDETLKPSVAE